MSNRRSGDAGLSLIEVLVSLAIFAVIGVAGLAVLNTVARTGERTEGRLERLAEIDRSFLIIRRDLAQITPAAIRLDPQSLSFQRASGDLTLKMAYSLDDTALIRRIDLPNVEPVEQRLLVGVTFAEWRLMGRARQWHTTWPPANQENTSAPIAAELTLRIERPEVPAPQTVTRLIVLPAGQSR